VEVVAQTEVRPPTGRAAAHNRLWRLGMQKHPRGNASFPVVGEIPSGAGFANSLPIADYGRIASGESK